MVALAVGVVMVLVVMLASSTTHSNSIPSMVNLG